MEAVDHARPTRVLVVDDEPSMRMFAERALWNAGYAVDAASGGPDALNIVEHEGLFDLFVIDMLMPDMRGDELARQLRQRDPDVKVLYFTGHADHLFAEKTVLWENEAVLEKPVTIVRFREAVSLLLFKHTLGPGRTPDLPLRRRRTTKIQPDELCTRCGSLLFPPHLAAGMVVAATTAFVCVNCGRAYEWTGHPPRLSVASPLVKTDDDDDD